MVWERVNKWVSERLWVDQFVDQCVDHRVGFTRRAQRKSQGNEGGCVSWANWWSRNGWGDSWLAGWGTGGAGNRQKKTCNGHRIQGIGHGKKVAWMAVANTGTARKRLQLTVDFATENLFVLRKLCIWNDDYLESPAGNVRRISETLPAGHSLTGLSGHPPPPRRQQQLVVEFDSSWVCQPLKWNFIFTRFRHCCWLNQWYNSFWMVDCLFVCLLVCLSLNLNFFTLLLILLSYRADRELLMAFIWYSFFGYFIFFFWIFYIFLLDWFILFNCNQSIMPYLYHIIYHIC